MNVKLVMTSYNRPEILKKCFSALKDQLHGRQLIIWDDGSTDKETLAILTEAEHYRDVVVNKAPYNVGPAKALNSVINMAFTTGADAVITLDNDVILGPDDWITKMVEFSAAHPEIGVLAPNKPGCYLRLHRNGYSEVEWAVSLCYLITKRAYQEIVEQDGTWYDESLGSSIDPDLCLRVRMLGYRVGICSQAWVTDLGEGKSTVSKNLGQANFKSNAKWNRRFLGRFLYKSPLMLRWEEYPPNVLFRRLLNAQEGTLGVLHSDKPFCHHAAEVIIEVACKGNRHPPETLKKVIEADIWVNKDQKVEELDDDLLTGKRKFDLETDAKGFQL